MPRLFVIRGNSGSGKGTIAEELRNQLSGKVALIGQDHFRRTVLKEKDVAGGDNIDLIALTVEFALTRGYDVILEGILAFERYGAMLTRLTAAWPDYYLYYLDIPFEETLRRHSTKQNATEFGEAEMRQWYIDLDLTGLPRETILPSRYSVEDSVAQILRDVRGTN